jgi:PST family polysaccharide transporter
MSAGAISGKNGLTQAGRSGRLTLQTLPLFAANAFRIAVQLALIPVLARIISPEAFGQVALAMPIVIFTSILAEAGLVTGLVRSEVSIAAESTAFWFTSGVGVACALAIAMISGPLGWAARQPPLTGILLALAPVLLLTCLTIVPSARLQRTGGFGSFATGEMLSSVSSATVALWAALHGWGAWSLVAQQLTQATIRLISNLRLSRFTPRLQFDYALLRPVLRLSTPLLGANMLAYLARSLDNLLIGLCIGAKPLGFYATAYQVVQIPEYALGASIRTTTMPAIAKVAADRHAAAAIYVNALRTLSLLATPAVIVCSLQAGALVRLVLGPAWAPAAPLVSILAPLGLVHCYFQLNAAVLLGFGEARTQLRMSVLASICGLLGIVAGFPWGPRGVALGYAIGTLFAAGPYFFCVLRALAAPWRRLPGGVGRAWVAGGVMALCMHAWSQRGAPHPQLIIGIAEAVLIGGGAYLTTLLFMELAAPAARRRGARLALEA